MNLKSHAITALAGSLLAAVAIAAPATADDFYAGKTVTIVVGAPATGSYASYALLLARHLGKYIPGHPAIKTDFRGGADGGLGAANYMENAAPKDGTFVGITQQTIPVNQFLQPGKVRYDVTKWKWIGCMAPVRNMLSLWHTAPAQSIEEAKKVEVKIGATGTSSPMYIVPHMMNVFLGTKFNIILGYGGMAAANLAMEQGEIGGRGASWGSVVIRTPHYIKDHLLKPIVVDGATRDPQIPDVPTLMELAPDKDTKQVFELLSASATFGRSFFVPPGVPDEQVATLRKAFMETLKDPELLAEAKKQHVVIEPVSADDLDAAIKGLQEIPAKVVTRAADAMKSK